MNTQDEVYQVPKKELAQGSTTVDYMVVPIGNLFVSYNKRPWFTLLQAETMLWDQQVWFGLQIGNSPLMQAEVEWVGPSREINAFAQEQWDRLWSHFAPKIVATKYFGYAGFEVTYSDPDDRGEFEIAGLKDFHPRDVRPLRQGGGRSSGDIAGVVIRGQRYPVGVVGERSQPPTRLFGMRGLWLNYNATYGSVFGRALTEKAYPAWWDKAFQGGAYDLRRLRAVKDAWIGDVFRYPSKGKLVMPDGTEISPRDVVRELAENRASGGVLVLPSDRDAQSGQYLYDYQRPEGIAHTSVIENWIKDADWDIFNGLLIPREVVEAAESGSGFSGRSIPMMMFLNIRDAEFRGYVEPIKNQIILPLVQRRFGAKAVVDVDAKPIPLLDTVNKKIGGSETGGPAGNQQAGGPGKTMQWGGPSDINDRTKKPESMQFRDSLEVAQFAIADPPPGSRVKQRIANMATSESDAIYSRVTRRLDSLLKKK